MSHPGHRKLSSHMGFRKINGKTFFTSTVNHDPITELEARKLEPYAVIADGKVYYVAAPDTRPIHLREALKMEPTTTLQEEERELEQKEVVNCCFKGL